jgi:hypothetical protein
VKSTAEERDISHREMENCRLLRLLIVVEVGEESHDRHVTVIGRNWFFGRVPFAVEMRVDRDSSAKALL